MKQKRDRFVWNFSHKKNRANQQEVILSIGMYNITQFYERL